MELFLNFISIVFISTSCRREIVRDKPKSCLWWQVAQIKKGFAHFDFRNRKPPFLRP